MKQILDPDFVQIAEHEGEAGWVFRFLCLI